jgi:lysophospholipase L1-like esterase
MKIGKQIFSALLILCFSGPLKAQSPTEYAYPFLHLEANVLQYMGDSTRFQLFFEKLDRILLEGEGKVRVVHMGGSHVQGGVLSHAMRENIQSLAPGLRGERGLVFPFKLAETNNPWNYVVKSTGDWDGARVSVNKHFSEWGISGISATATDPSSTATLYSRYDDHPFDFEKVRIFYHQCECSYEPIISNDAILSSRIDSLGSFIEVSFSIPQDTLYFGLRKTDSTQTQFILQGIQFLREGPGVVYNPIGVNGASTDDYLRSQKFPDQLKSLSPDLVIFGIGINDANTYAKKFDQAAFESYYRQLVRYFREANPDVAILFLTNNDSYFQKRYANPNAYKVRQSMFTLAEECNGAVWDLFEVMGGLDSIRTWEAYDLASSDRIHFTRKGYQLQAELLFMALREAFGDYLSARFSRQP